MPIASTDILYKFSVLTGAAGNSGVGTMIGSLGKYLSTTQITTATMNNLFDDVTGDENLASNPEYKCFFVHNAHATLSLQNAVVWISADVAGGAVPSISVDTTGITVVGSATAQAKQVVNEDTAPATQTFTAPVTKATGLALGTIPAGSCVAVWVKRTPANTVALASDGCTLRVEGDTAP